MDLFLLFSAAIIGALTVSYFSLPPIFGYVVSGLVISTVAPEFIDQQAVSFASEIGIVLLLFSLGIEFSIDHLKKVFLRISVLTVFQVILTSVIGYKFFQLLGMPPPYSFYAAVAASLSSTAIVVKMMGRSGQLDSPQGTVAIAWLVVQDLLIVPIMIVLPGLAGIPGGSTVSGLSGSGSAGWVLLLFYTVIAVTAVAVLLLFRLFYMPQLLNAVMSKTDRETFLLGTIVFVGFFAVVFETMGFSAALGAFLAGLIISRSREHHMVSALISPLRDIFAVLFFTSLGMSLPVGKIINIVPLILQTAVFLMLVKGLIIALLLRISAFSRRVSWITGFSLIQMSEFGFVLAREGVVKGQLNETEYLELISLTLMTIILSTPLVQFLPRIYGYAQKHWSYLFAGGLRLKKTLTIPQNMFQNHVIVCGHGRIGSYIVRALNMSQIPVVAVDQDYSRSSLVDDSGNGEGAVIHGDPVDAGILEAAGIETARYLILTIPDVQTQEIVAVSALKKNPHLVILSRIHHAGDRQLLKNAGVKDVIQPEFEAALRFVNKLLLDYNLNKEDIAGKVRRLKIEHGLDLI
jgi:CPA2 family monovalent cation:H+ antiporter-2